MEPNAISLNAVDEGTLFKSDDALRPEMPNPFVGLRPFQSTEGLLFFGRREQTVELLQQLHRTRFLAVVGSSGSGKSSLIRAGLIPKVKAGFLVERRDKWRFAIMKPGEAPLRNLVLALIEAFSEEANDDSIKGLAEAIQVSGLQAIIDHLIPRLEESDTNLFLLIDQFEEIFRFGLYADNDSPFVETDDKEKRRDEAAEFVSIMLGLAQRPLPVYVVMTMRSDFLGDCDIFCGLPEAMNRSQYLVPRLTRQQRQEAIEGPIRLYGEAIARNLLDCVLNDVGEDSDQLPVMQHALMRTWEKWREETREKWQEEEKKGPIDLSHYKAIGTIKDALSQDADRAMGGMSDEERISTERLFQALTKMDARGRRLRRPAHLSELVAVTGAGHKTVLEIIDRFRTNNRDFLTLSEDKLKGDPLIDISHESLIRQWETLRQWVDAEAKSRELYLRLAGDAVRYANNEVPLWSDPALQLVLEWWESRLPNEEWAQRYHPEFKETRTFLEKSKEKRELDAAEAERVRNERAEQERKDLEEKAAGQRRELELAQAFGAQQTRAARRLRILIATLLFIVAVASALGFYAYEAKGKAEQEAAANDQYRAARRLLEESRIEEAQEKFNEALGAYQAIDDYKGAAYTWTELGKLSLMDKETSTTEEEKSAHELSRKYYDQAIDLYRSHQNHIGAATALKAVGEMLSERLLVDEFPTRRGSQSSLSIARDYFDQALKEYEDGDNIEGQVQVLSEIGDLILRSGIDQSGVGAGPVRDAEKGKLQTAIGYYERTLPLYERLIEQLQNPNLKQRAQKELSSKLIKIGNLYHHKGDDVTAAKTFQQAANVYERISNLEEAANTYFEIGLTLKREERNDKSRQDLRSDKYYEQAVQISHQTRNLKQEADLLKRIAQTYDRDSDGRSAGIKSDWKTGLDYYEQALPIYERLKDRKAQAEIRITIGRIESNVGKYGDALKAFQQALAFYGEAKDQEGQATAYQGIGSIQEALGKSPQALDSYTQALNLRKGLADEQAAKSLQKRIDGLKTKIARELLDGDSTPR